MLKIFLIILSLVIGYSLFLSKYSEAPKPLSEIVEKILPTPTPKVSLLTPSQSKVLPGGTHVFQSFNNCGPAALSMALSYYGINRSQADLGQLLRPYQVPSGDNDDKSVTLPELAEKSKEFGFTPYYRPNGDINLIKLFITYDIPVITRTWLKKDEDVGHYRVVKGYTNDQIIQDDSLQGKNLYYTEEEFNQIWKKFNYEYLVLVPDDKKEVAEAILGEDLNEKNSWEKSVELSKKQLLENPDDIYARFNLSVAYHNVGKYQDSVDEFEKVEDRLPFRTLWYQIEPIKSYYQLGDYSRVLSLTEKVLSYHNRAYSEAYILRGDVYKAQGNIQQARAEYEKAVMYNINLKSAREKLNSL